jgi:hypothetical protein
MALIHVHKVMITAALLFSAGFAVRSVIVGEAGIGAAFGAITVGLAIYFRWFLRTKAVQLTEE